MKLIRSLVLLLIAGVFYETLYSAPQGSAGILEGIVVRDGTNQPLSNVQITVGSSSVRTPVITGPKGQAITVTPQMAQQLLDAVARGDTGRVPPEYMDAAQEVARGAAAARTVVTDSSGHFTLNNVPLGNVSVRAELEGYFGSAVAGNHPRFATETVTVTEGRVASVRLSLVPGGNINGRVFDSAGKPMSEFPVQLLRRAYHEGTATLELVDLKTTNDRGEYRLYRMPPGEFYLAAAPRKAAVNSARPSSNPASRPHEIPMATLYPSAAEIGSAIPIALRAGGELFGMDIQVQTQMTFRVSGRVISNLPPGPVTGPRGQIRPSIASVTIVPSGKAGKTSPGLASVGLIDDGSATVPANPDDGSFEISNVRPGSYDVIARLPAAPYTDWGPGSAPQTAGNPWAFGRTHITVNGANVENVNVAVHHGYDLNGRVVLNGKPAAATIRISLLADGPAGSAGDSQSANIFAQIASFVPAIAQDGSFAIPLVPEGRYTFRIGLGESASVASLPATAYVADIRQGNISVYDNGLTVNNEPVRTIEVLINSDGGSIEGAVTALGRKPASGSTVVLVPEENRRQNSALYKTARADEQGRFVLNTVAPGRYKLFAWDSVPPGAHQNREFLATYEQRGVAVVVAPGARATAEIGLISTTLVR